MMSASGRAAHSAARFRRPIFSVSLTKDSATMSFTPLRYCSPTRAALITGHNHHSVASGVITEMATGYPGYNSLVPKSAGSVGEVLKENGYNTFWYGKMNNVPDWMSSQAG